jgi:lipoic acid synthetase
MTDRLNLVQEPLPPWLRRKLASGGQMAVTGAVLRKYRLNTVCEEAKCPNRVECYAKQTATFLALGKACTRNCGFCDIDFTKTPVAPERDEPLRIACSVRELGLKHVVVTMVARDDLVDGGAEHIAEIIRSIRKENPGVTIEVLTSDFGGDHRSLDRVLAEHPEIFNHNIETVRSLSSRVRHRAEYDRTLGLLHYAKQSGNAYYVKSGLMVGLQETEKEVQQTIRDLAGVGCDVITIGQYLQPSSKKLRVKKFVSPEQFAAYAEFGQTIGVKHMYCGPFVRSSYNANLFVPNAVIDSQ